MTRRRRRWGGDMVSSSSSSTEIRELHQELDIPELHHPHTSESFINLAFASRPRFPQILARIN